MLKIKLSITLLKKMTINRILLIFVLSLLTINCGFKVVDRSDFGSFNIAEINTTGEKKINFKIRNKLLFNSKEENQRNIVLNLVSLKNKNVKEKNINNKIIKYQIDLVVNVNYLEVGTNKSGDISIKKSGDYNVADQHSQTLNNEKNLLNNLIDDIADELYDELIVNLNDI